LYRTRYYAPAIARSLQTDPIQTAGGINLYAYVGNDPVNNTDPSERYAIVDDIIFTLGGAALGVAGQVE
jgi:uncharacterized protein RhaS with RHS repeats